MDTKLIKLIFAAVAAAIGSSSPTFAQSPPQQVQTEAPAATVPTLPSNLCGRWYTPDQRWSQIWCLNKIDQAASSAEVTFHSTATGNCSIEKMPTRLEFDSVIMKVTASDMKSVYMHCATRFAAELTKIGDEWKGKIWLDTAGTKYDYVETTVKAP